MSIQHSWTQKHCDRLFCLLHRVLSALAHWAAIFGEVEYLPLVAFPFVKLFQNNPMLCFEVVATVIGIFLQSSIIAVRFCNITSANI